MVAAPGSTRRSLLDLVEAQPGISPSQAAKLLGVAPATIHHHTRVLADAGLIEVRLHRTDARRRRLRAKPANDDDVEPDPTGVSDPRWRGGAAT